MKTSISSIRSAFTQAFAQRRDDRFSHLGERMVTAGCETRMVSAEYRWDGMKRGESRESPRVTFQATLSGWGRFERGGRRWKVEPGSAFFAVLPSRHRYDLPEESAEWTFFWFHIGHPYIVQRIIALAKRHLPVFELKGGAGFLHQNLALFERICGQRFEDEFDEEAALFEWLFSFERHLRAITYPHVERRAMLDAVREFTLANLERSFGIDEIARRTGLSRSHYCHRFKDATGLTPAAYVAEVRLAEARQLLRKSPVPLKEIAIATGFADANHLCKAFRRHYKLSPGAYRGQYSCGD